MVAYCGLVDAGLIGVSGGRSTNQSILYELDPTNGSIMRTIGNTGLAHLTGIAFHPTTGVLYGHQTVIGSDSGFLYTIDTNTATPTLIGATHLSASDLTFSPSGELYGWMVFYEQNFPAFTDIHELVRFNLNTGVATQVGLSQNFFPTRVGLSFDRTGQLYLKSAGEIFTLNPTNGVPTVQATLSQQTHNVLAFDEANRALSITRSYNGNSFVSAVLQQINVNTGTVTTLGGNIGVEITAIAFTTSSVPEPSSWVVAVVGLLTLGTYKYLRS
jgi:hypothetical protein